MHPLPENEFTKDPRDVLPYGLDWQTWMEREGFEGTPTFEWEIPQEIDAGMEPFEQVVDGHVVSAVWLKDGDPGRSYRVFCTITAGQKKTRRSIVIHVGAG